MACAGPARRLEVPPPRVGCCVGLILPDAAVGGSLALLKTRGPGWPIGERSFRACGSSAPRGAGPRSPSGHSFLPTWSSSFQAARSRRLTAGQSRSGRRSKTLRPQRIAATSPPARCRQPGAPAARRARGQPLRADLRRSGPPTITARLAARGASEPSARPTIPAARHEHTERTAQRRGGCRALDVRRSTVYGQRPRGARIRAACAGRSRWPSARVRPR